MGSVAPRVELLWWRGCPSTERALAELRQTMADLGLDPEAVAVREVRDDAQAAREGFVGSPTVRVDGCDVVAPGAAEPHVLACRIYRRRDGRVSPTPDRADVRTALVEAMTRRST
jgi:hypothetical protein